MWQGGYVAIFQRVKQNVSPKKPWVFLGEIWTEKTTDFLDEHNALLSGEK